MWRHGSWRQSLCLVKSGWLSCRRGSPGVTLVLSWPPHFLCHSPRFLPTGNPATPFFFSVRRPLSFACRVSNLTTPPSSNKNTESLLSGRSRAQFSHRRDFNCRVQQVLRDFIWCYMCKGRCPQLWHIIASVACRSDIAFTASFPIQSSGSRYNSSFLVIRHFIRVSFGVPKPYTNMTACYTTW